MSTAPAASDLTLAMSWTDGGIAVLREVEAEAGVAPLDPLSGSLRVAGLADAFVVALVVALGDAGGCVDAAENSRLGMEL